MNEEELDIELIEKYFERALSPDEQEQFDVRLATDAGFSEKLNDYKDIIEGVRFVARQEFRRDVSAWESETSTEGGAGSTTWWRPYMSVAAGLLILALAALYLLNAKKETAADLFLAYFTPYPDVVSVRGNNPKAVLHQALAAYNSEDYPSATSLLKTYLDSKPGDETALFYLAISELASGNADVSIRNLEKVIDANGVFREQAAWYRALAYLRKNDIQTARKLLQEMTSSDGHDYQSKASDLARKLK